MKTWAKPYLFAWISLFVLMFLFSVISSSLYTFDWISTDLYHLFNRILPYISFLISGLCFGFFIEKKVLIQALLMTFFLILLSFLIQENTNGIHFFLHHLLWLCSALFFPCIFRH